MKLHDPAATLRFGAPLVSARRLVILLHGRGSSAEDIAQLASRLEVEGCAFAAPSATGGAWYPERFFVPLERNEPWLSSALAVVEALIGEAVAAGRRHEEVALIGFSQGACLALESVARRPRRYALVAGLSGGLIGPLDTVRPAVALQRTPVLVACAERDAHIPLDYVDGAAEYFRQWDAELTKQIFPGAVHGIYRQEVDWLNAQLA